MPEEASVSVGAPLRDRIVRLTLCRLEEKAAARDAARLIELLGRQVEHVW